MPAHRTTAISIVAVPLLLASSILVGCAPVGGESISGVDSAQAILQRGDFDRQLLLTGELEAVRSIAIKSPQTNLFQMRIQFMAEEGSGVFSCFI